MKGKYQKELETRVLKLVEKSLPKNPEQAKGASKLLQKAVFKTKQ